MPRLTRGRLPHRQALNAVMIYTARAPKDTAQPPNVFLRSLRAALKMSQANLARRAGVAQSHVARIESGRVDAQLETWRKLFDAMFCDLLVIPKPRKRPGDALADRRLDKPHGGNPWAD